ncbi:MAG: hypothetical protein AB7O45_08270 [Alphaproteobacteria bacterium]
MPKMIQISDMPDALYERLEQSAAGTGMSLSDDVLCELRRIADRPTIDEMRTRLERRPPATLSISPADAVRDERDRR